MDCTRHFLNFHWEHHSWRRRVTLAANVPCEETSMWGSPVNREFVRCHTQEICAACGEIRDTGECICDPAHAARCSARLAFIDASGHATGS